MTDYNNKKSAYRVAQQRIQREEAFINTDYEKLSFEEKCRYALEISPLLHCSVSPDSKRREKLLKALRPELLRRAETEDPFALYVLGSENYGIPANDVERRFLERSMKAGYVPAAMDLLNRVYYGKRRETPEAKKIEEWLSEYMEEESEEVSPALSVEEILDKLRNSQHDFHETVEYLVLDHFYNKGYHHLGDKLGMMLVQERGCVQDTEKISKIYTDLMMRYRYDRRQLLALTGVPHNETSEDLYEAERVCRLLIKSGRDSNCWRLILIALLSGNRKRLEAICNEICKLKNGACTVHVSKAYHMLLHT
jgi:hypothetical protein